MNEEIRNKLYNLLDTIDNNEKVIRMKKLKKDIYASSKLKELFDEFRIVSNNEYSERYIKLKKDILNNSIISEYKSLENELYFTVLEMNKLLNSLVNKRMCHR